MTGTRVAVEPMGTPVGSLEEFFGEEGTEPADTTLAGTTPSDSAVATTTG